MGRFGVTDLTLNDALIIGYGYFGASASSQPIHRDASLFSLNVALSPISDYSNCDDNIGGGGTYFEGLDCKNESIDANIEKNRNDDKEGKQHAGLIKMEQGHVLCHSSGTMHAGNGIQNGERWVLVLFCLSKSKPQYARRCHSEGVKLCTKGDFDSAVAMFEAGLSQDRNDHLLHISLGRIYAALGNEIKSHHYLKKAAELYLTDPNLLISLGKLYLSQRQAFKAFVCFDLVLSRIQNSDLKKDAWTPLKAAGWDARVHAGRCAVICAEEEAMNNTIQDYCHDSNENNGNVIIDVKNDVAGEISRGSLLFTRAYLPEAIQRINIALHAAPQDTRLIGLLARAEELLKEANTR